MHSDTVAHRASTYPSALGQHGGAVPAPGPMGGGVPPRDDGAPSTGRSKPTGRFYRPAAPSPAGSASRQARDVLVQTLVERGAELVEHSSAVARLADLVARRLGVGDPEREEIRMAAELHDVGKVAVSEAILNKPAPLNRAERLAVELHPAIGERILAAAPALAGVATVVRSSHERADGRGYPDRLQGNDVPIGSRVIAVCDAYDAMISDRPYRQAISTGAALEELRRHAGAQFDLVVVRIVCELVSCTEEQRSDESERAR